MKITWLLLVAILSFSAHGMGSRRPVPAPEAPKQAPVNIADPGSVSLWTNVMAEPETKARIERLAVVANKIWNSEQFKQRVLGAMYKGKLQFVDAEMTNLQVYDKLRKSNELGSGDDYRMDLRIGLYRMSKSTLGQTTPDDPFFYFNTYGFSSRSDAGVTGTICHEYTHKLGFDHSYRDNAARPYSVPYAVGTICAELYPIFK